MHEFSRFIQEQLDARGWNRADLSRRSGLTESHLRKLLIDKRDRLPSMPEPDTIAALARGFGIDERIVIAHAAAACYGVPVEGPVEAAGPAALGTDELLHEIAVRLRAKPAAGETLDIDALEHRAVTDIIDLMVQLRSDATGSEGAGKPGLAIAQRFLADQLEAALDASAARAAKAGRARPARNA